MSSDCNTSTSESSSNNAETGLNNTVEPRINRRRIVPRKVRPENARNKPHPEMKDWYDLVERDRSHTSPVWKYCHLIKESKDSLYTEPNHDIPGPSGIHKWCVCNCCARVLKVFNNKGWTGGSLNQHLTDVHGIKLKEEKKRDSNGNIK